MHKMILKLALGFFASFICISSFCQINNSTALLHKMYDRYHGKWPATLTFNQTTERFRNDSLIMTQEWEEYIQHPNLFRIDFGDTADHNFVIYKNDSSYLFRKSKLVRATKDENELLFFLGGMYFMPFESVLKHFEELHYDLNKFHKTTWQGKPVYVIGANNDADTTNQLWIDAEKLIAVRFISYDNHRKEEGIFEKHIPVKGGWTETQATFYFDNKKLQVEHYHDVKAGEKIPSQLFEVFR